MKVPARAVQVAGGSLGLIPEAQPLTQALLDRWLQPFCFLGGATARYCAGIGADLKAPARGAPVTGRKFTPLEIIRTNRHAHSFTEILRTARVAERGL